MSEQIDIAVDLGAVAAPLPEILTLRQLVETAPEAPVQIIEGVLHQWCRTPSIICTGASGAVSTNCLKVSISGSGAATAPKSTAMSICSLIQRDEYRLAL